MWAIDHYHLGVATGQERLPAAIAERAFERVWRVDFSAPGFCVLDLGPGTGSHGLRATMLDLKEGLSDITSWPTAG